jgi:ankyrin repeat protein
VDYLIAWGSNLNKQDVDGYTPLHLAIIAGNGRIAKKLLNRGAD